MSSANRGLETGFHKKIVLQVVSTVVAFLAFWLFFSAVWSIKNVADIDLYQIIYFFTSNKDGTDSNLVWQYLLEAFLPTLLCTAAFYFFFFAVCKRKFSFQKNGFWQKLLGKIFPLPKRRLIALLLSIALFAGSVTYSAVYFDVHSFLTNLTEESNFIESNYADPETTQITFPEKKRNLIYIFMESTETTFFSKENGGLLNAMPELEQLALENTNFSNGSKLGGALQYASTDWTIAGLTAQTAGLPLKSSLKNNRYGKGDEFLPGAYSLGEVLAKAGYRNHLLIGSDKSFANRDKYFTQHGNYSIYDLNSAIEDGIVKEDNGFWGFEDSILFNLAKQQITELAKDSSTPFNFSVLTVDTHYPYGWNCPDCPSTAVAEDPSDNAQVKYANYKNAMACSGKKVADLVRWIQQQDFYENTTVVISGDHLSMSTQISEDAEENNYNRTTVNIFINPAKKAKSTKNRAFGTFDMYPTTLAALGCNIKGDCLGLGTNLFSGKRTLTEKVGFDCLNDEIKKQSSFYSKSILGKRS